MLLKIGIVIALCTVVGAPLVVLFTETSLVELLLYTLSVEAILGALFIVFTDDFSLLSKSGRKLREFEHKYL